MHSHRDYRHTGDYGFCVRWKLERADNPIPAGPARIAGEIMDACSRYQPRSLEFPASRLFSEMEGASVYELELIFLKWFLELVRVMNPDMALATDQGMESRQSQVVQRVLLYLEEYSALNIDVHQLARSVGYSYRHLARLFKEKTGSTLIEKLNGIRIAKAIDLLENTDMKIKAICGEVGFHTETYFSRIFAEYTHQPPSLFRIAHRKRT
jgi:AraC-like DNA-binding protein